MDLSFFPLTLEAIDRAAAESLCLFIAEDERPLTGLAGLADWRLSGRLSRLLRNGALTGSAGEAVLTSPGGRLGFQKLFLFGVGPKGQDEAEVALQLGEGLRKIAQAGVQEAALQLPARLSPEVAIRTLIEELQGPARAMVFTSDPHRLMAALTLAASDGKAQLERRVVKVPAPAKKPAAQPPRQSTQTPAASNLEPPASAAQPAAAAIPHPPPAPISQSAKHPAPPAPPPPPARPAPAPPPARPAPAPSQRYVPPEPTQNVFDKSKRKKR